MLRVEGLSVSYGGKDVLKGVSLELKSGVGCLLGPNGAGKSTLMKCIAGILRPRGRVILDDTDLLELPERERARLVSYSPQEFSVNFPYTVFEVVLMGRNPYVSPVTGPTTEDEKKALEALKALGIENLAERPFIELSGGQKRLAMIARSIAQDGRLFLFDEPTSFLDFRNQYLVLSAIRELGRKKLVLISLHDPNQAFAFCDVVFLLKDGSLMASGDPKIVMTSENLSELYGLPVAVGGVGDRIVVFPKVNRSVLRKTELLTRSVIKDRSEARL
ncbi:ABC transporter ATP-binding protein [Thermococcus eurythermalis]|uniref:ABC transporter ATP-binding protein n=1 Tax=Thermococcus eurythermalis TaxID=1505907 RepID=UPI0006795D32|nr:ABC transporter ATP-binding protein [Thermococcus eurythermalis]